MRLDKVQQLRTGTVLQPETMLMSVLSVAARRHVDVCDPCWGQGCVDVQGPSSMVQPEAMWILVVHAATRDHIDIMIHSGSMLVFIFHAVAGSYDEIHGL